MIFTCANSATNICEGFLNDGYNQKSTEKILGKRIDMMRIDKMRCNCFKLTIEVS